MRFGSILAPARGGKGIIEKTPPLKGVFFLLFRRGVINRNTSFERSEKRDIEINVMS